MRRREMSKALPLTAAGIGGTALGELRPVEEIYDLFERKTLARNAGEFQVKLPPASATLFYTGAAELLDGVSHT